MEYVNLFETSTLEVEYMNEIQYELRTLAGEYLIEFAPHNYSQNEIPVIEQVAYIENTIEAVGKIINYGEKSIGYNQWQQSKVWELNQTQLFSYKDINRWLNNMLVIKYYQEEPGPEPPPVIDIPTIDYEVYSKEFSPVSTQKNVVTAVSYNIVYSVKDLRNFRYQYKLGSGDWVEDTSDLNKTLVRFDENNTLFVRIIQGKDIVQISSLTITQLNNAYNYFIATDKNFNVSSGVRMSNIKEGKYEINGFDVYEHTQHNLEYFINNGYTVAEAIKEHLQAFGQPKDNYLIQFNAEDKTSAQVLFFNRNSVIGDEKWPKVTLYMTSYFHWTKANDPVTENEILFLTREENELGVVWTFTDNYNVRTSYVNNDFTFDYRILEKDGNTYKFDENIYLCGSSKKVISGIFDEPKFIPYDNTRIRVQNSIANQFYMDDLVKFRYIMGYGGTKMEGNAKAVIDYIDTAVEKFKETYGNKEYCIMIEIGSAYYNTGYGRAMLIVGAIDKVQVSSVSRDIGSGYSGVGATISFLESVYAHAYNEREPFSVNTVSTGSYTITYGAFKRTSPSYEVGNGYYQSYIIPMYISNRNILNDFFRD